jgi:hypothetical protein
MDDDNNIIVDDDNNIIVDDDNNIIVDDNNNIIVDDDNNTIVDDNNDRDDDNLEIEVTGTKKFQYAWLIEFRWLRYDNDNKVMYCIYCRNHNIKTTAFGKSGSKNISKKSAIIEHSKCSSHKQALQLEASKTQMEVILSESFDQSAKYVIGLMKIVFYMIKNNIPFSKFPSQVELAIALEAPDIVNENSTNYINVKSANEFLNSFSNIVADRLWKDLFDADFFSIMIDESTDITVEKHLVVYITYIKSDGIIRTKFLALFQLTSGDAQTISSVLINLFRKHG